MVKLNWWDMSSSSQTVIGPLVLDVYRPPTIHEWYCQINGDRTLGMFATRDAAKEALEETVLRVCESIVSRLSPTPTDF